MVFILSLYDRYAVMVMKLIYKRSPRIKKYKQKLTARAEKSGVIRQGFTFLFSSYKKYFYCDKNSGEGYFFRCKHIEAEGKYPIVIYQHGNGLNRVGKNNMQLFEFSKLMRKLDKHKCHQVAIHLDVTCEYNRAEHSRALEGFIQFLENTYNNVDFDRIYLAGTSHGGYACVYEVLRNPQKYAAAVVSMAYTFNEEIIPTEEICENSYVRSLTDEDYKLLSKTPFYLSWAKDDCMNMTISNALLSKNLKKNNAKLKEKIYETGGHSIAGDFFENSDWDEWMFGMKRTITSEIQSNKV